MSEPMEVPVDKVLARLQQRCSEYLMQIAQLEALVEMLMGQLTEHARRAGADTPQAPPDV